jgi:hypothetical protein
MSLTPPVGACDAHCPIFGPHESFPYAREAVFIPSHDAQRLLVGNPQRLYRFEASV